MKFTLTSLLVIVAVAQHAAATVCCQQNQHGQQCPLPPPTTPFVEARSAQVCCCVASTKELYTDVHVVVKVMGAFSIGIMQWSELSGSCCSGFDKMIVPGFTLKAWLVALACVARRALLC
ncbi:hypothetical protein BC629DRAFT_1462921 [Irpex lacteus]|nr:hypothetical protein BC629DRAFT_1462921 [Irpex lacteus]